MGWDWEIMETLTIMWYFIVDTLIYIGIMVYIAMYISKVAFAIGKESNLCADACNFTSSATAAAHDDADDQWPQ